MGASYGLVEVTGVVAAVDCLDAMCKAAEVRLLTWERKLGGRLVTLIVQGSVSDVTAAVQAAMRICKVNQHNIAAHGIIPNPCAETEKMVLRSAKRLAMNK